MSVRSLTVTSVRILFAISAVLVMVVLQTAGVLHAHSHVPGEDGHRHAYVVDDHHFGHPEDRAPSDGPVDNRQPAEARVAGVVFLLVALAVAALWTTVPQQAGGGDRQQRPNGRPPPISRRLVAVAVQQV